VPSLHTQPIESVERFFQFSLLGLIASAYFALAGSGFLDRPTLVLTFIGLLIRAAMVAGLLRIGIPVNIVSAAALGYIVFFPIDFYFLSRDFLATTVHGVCFLATVKILTAQSNRDYVWTGVISFVELISAALLSAHSSFFAYLGVYVVFSIAAFTSAEIRRGFQKHERQVATPPRARVSWRLGVVAVTATCGILVITAGLFLIVPRTARMAAMLFPNSQRLTGFSDVVDLGGFGKLSRDDRAVLHILSYSRPLPPDLKWRGAALSRFDGKRWSEPALPGRTVPTVHGYAEIADLNQRSRRDGGRLIYRVDVQNSGTGTLFIAGIPEFVNADVRNLLLTPDGSVRLATPTGESLRYEVSAHSGAPLASPLAGQEKSRYLELPLLDIRVYSLARQWSGDGAPLDRALRIQRHLQRDLRYTLDGPEQPVRDPLADFLFTRKAGYCEYFASAMAVMLRAEGIPSRVATGFQSGYFNDVSGLNVVRASDAHAWVEAWIEGPPDNPAAGRWMTFDPTPLAPAASRAGLFSRVNMYLDAADHAWQEWVVSYDLTQQVAMAARFEAALRSWSRPNPTPNRNWSALLVNAVKSGGAVLIAALVFIALLARFGPRFWRVWRKRVALRQIIRTGGSPSDARILYERMLEILARRGFRKPPWFTPVEFARHLPASENNRVVEFTDVYNSIRFGGNRAATSRLAELLQEFERTGQHRPVDHLTIQ
jgi:transglutaminase-like putative cysteine protease